MSVWNQALLFLRGLSEIYERSFRRRRAKFEFRWGYDRKSFRVSVSEKPQEISKARFEVSIDGTRHKHRGQSDNFSAHSKSRLVKQSVLSTEPHIFPASFE